ncbi:ABC transporter substrate-binding protein [Haloarculaceae archaeon H-GB2-1]|nr:ABC transporter substrate-binding protein [Haloarculaceae archaeon H-GB2-1]
MSRKEAGAHGDSGKYGVYDLADRLDRRRFMQIVGVGGLAGLAGCTGNGGSGGTETDSSGTETQTTAQATAASSEIPKGGTLEVGWPRAPSNLIPVTGVGTEDYMLADWLYSKLVWIDKDLNLIPDLATDWEANDDASVWNFQLREGAKFNTLDKEVLAEDVKAHLDAIQNPDYLPGAKGTLGPIDSVEIVNDYEVEITYTGPYSPAPSHLTARTGGIMPKEIIGEDHEQAAETDYGSGPFVVDEFDPGNSVSMSANPDYYLSDDAGTKLPYVDKLNAQAMPDAIQRLNALNDGRIHINQNVSSSSFEQAKSMDNVNAVKGPGTRWYGVCMNSNKEPFDDNRVRDALKYAMDKRQQLNVALNGMGSIARNHPITPSYKFHPDPPIETKYGPEAKPEKAKEKLAEAGYPDGIELPTFMYSKQSQDSSERFAQLWQRNAANAGIEFEITNITEDRWLGEIWNSERAWYWTSWAMKFPTQNMLTLSCTSDAPWNDHRFSNEEFDSLVQEASKTADIDKRRDLYRDALSICHNNGGWIIPFYVSKLTAANKQVVNYRANPLGQYMFVERTGIKQSN